MKEKRGVTLIAPIVTVTILLILTNIIVTTLVGENSILAKAIESRKKEEEAAIREEVVLGLAEYQIEQKTKEIPKTLKCFIEEKWNTEITDSGNTYNFIYKKYLFTVNAITSEVISSDEFDMKVSNVYGSVEEMKKDSNLKKNMYVQTLGYYNQKLGGGAYYKIVNEKLTSSEIDNMMVISLNNGLYAKYMIMGDMITARQMGAYGDGEHDDRLNIQTAVNNLENGTIYFENGTYKVSSRINIDKEISLNGENKETTKLEATKGFVLWNNIVQFINTKNIKVNNLTFDGYSEVNARDTTNDSGETYKLESTYQLLNLENVSNILIQDCMFRDNVGGAVLMQHGSDNFTIDSCELLNVDCGIILMNYNQNVQCSNYTFTNNVFEGHEYSESISFYTYGEFTNVKISENTFRNKSYGDGILFDEKTVCSNVVVNNNKFYGQVAITIKSSNMANIAISNNNITDVPELHHAITISGQSQNIEIVGNTFENIYGDVLYAVQENSYLSNLKFCSNIINISKTSQIILKNLNSNELLIYNNEFLYSGDSDVYAYMLRNVTIDNIKIFDNRYSSNKLKKWIDNSTAILYLKEKEGGVFVIEVRGKYEYLKIPYEFNENIIP